MTPLSRFNKAMGHAHSYLGFARDRRGVLINDAGWIELAIAQVQRALGIANTMQDRQRRALCLRILNWLRADLARRRARRLAA